MLKENSQEIMKPNPPNKDSTTNTETDAKSESMANSEIDSQKFDLYPKRKIRFQNPACGEEIEKFVLDKRPLSCADIMEYEVCHDKVLRPYTRAALKNSEVKDAKSLLRRMCF